MDVEENPNEDHSVPTLTELGLPPKAEVAEESIQLVLHAELIEAALEGANPSRSSQTRAVLLQKVPQGKTYRSAGNQLQLAQPSPHRVGAIRVDELDSKWIAAPHASPPRPQAGECHPRR